MDAIPRIAIACQGGGSHTAFTAGVLQRVLASDAHIVGLSGTSGGAICALIAWFGLLLGQRAEGARRLDAFWESNAAASLPDWLLNEWIIGTSRLRGRVALPELSPYEVPDWAQQQLRERIAAQVDFAAIPGLLGPASPRLYVGAVDVLSGAFTVFRDAAVSADAVLASAAIPDFFRAVAIGEGAARRYFWDGLFSQNPPVRELTETRPDELWVVQINPSTRAAVPHAPEDIADRRNELAGNLSLEQELHFIDKINALLADGCFPDGRYKPIAVRRIRLQRELDYASKLDRDPGFIRGLIEEGRRTADAFLAARRG